MKRSLRVHFSITALLVVSMFAPVATLAFDGGKKHFTDGMKYEAAEQWDKAVEEFALAVSDTPKNPEYRLHLQRALFNASQMYMKKGTEAANEKDYPAGYLAFKRAYAYDPTNELAKSEMDRMVRLQQDLVDSTPGRKGSTDGAKMIPTGYNTPDANGPQLPQKLEKLRDLPFPSGVDLQFIIKELAKDLDLNVLFDRESFSQPNRKTSIDIKNVTAAQALDYIFLQEGLFFQRVGPRTILVANQQQRTKFQQLVLKTFYLANASPKDVAKVVQTAIPAQPGRSQTIVLTDDATNSITIRDTSENIRLIGHLISALDKDRAEVVMDVAIYEVNRTDLLQLGNQIGSQTELTTLGGSSTGVLGLGGKNIGSTIVDATGAAVATTLPGAIATGIILPSMNLSAFQNKNDTKLIASTQIHSFNNEDSSATIGQRVPVQSASFNTGVVNSGTGSNGVVSNVINYEQVGLTLKFKPLVFPNQDVQVTMDIESKDVAGAQTFTPTFTERTIKGTARIQNNKTLLLASVAQGQQSNGKAGLPLLGLVPIIGRLFTTPTRDNRQVDIVIAVTPRVIRAPAILPEDEVEHNTGSIAIPTNSSLEAMIQEEDRQEMLAQQKRGAASTVPNTVAVQLPDQRTGGAAPTYVKTADTVQAAPDQKDVAQTQPAGPQASAVTDPATVKPAAPTIPAMLQPIDSGVKTLQLKQTADVVDTPPASGDAQPTKEASSDQPAAPAPAASGTSVALQLGTLPELKAGDKFRVPVVISGSAAFASAVIGLKFDPKQVAVRTVSYGDVFSTQIANTAVQPFVNQDGKMYVSLSPQGSSDVNALGNVAYIEIEALAPGRPAIGFDKDILSFLTRDGKSISIKVNE